MLGVRAGHTEMEQTQSLGKDGSGSEVDTQPADKVQEAFPKVGPFGLGFEV